MHINDLDIICFDVFMPLFLLNLNM
jgi:hypothetical protein